jgi:hypothetical protein
MSGRRWSDRQRVSEKLANHSYVLALHLLYYNFVCIHQTLKPAPAMATGVTERLWEIKDVVEMLEAWETVQPSGALNLRDNAL